MAALRGEKNQVIGTWRHPYGNGRVSTLSTLPFHAALHSHYHGNIPTYKHF